MRIAFLALALVMLVNSGIAAQPSTNTASTSFQVDLNLSNPGARSLALGGAFVALADDATAAFANPAGLTNSTLSDSPEW
jgi:long-chain fatty acid transport protein